MLTEHQAGFRLEWLGRISRRRRCRGAWEDQNEIQRVRIFLLQLKLRSVSTRNDRYWHGFSINRCYWFWTVLLVFKGTFKGSWSIPNYVACGVNFSRLCKDICFYKQACIFFTLVNARRRQPKRPSPNGMQNATMLDYLPPKDVVSRNASWQVSCVLWWRL